MREKYESLSLSVLRDLAKARGLRGISTLKKADLIQKMLLEDEKEKIQSQEPGMKEEEGKQQQDEYVPSFDGQRSNENSRNLDHGRYGEGGRNYENGHNSERKPTLNNEVLDSGEKANGILEVLPDGYGFIRCENYLPGENDIYVSQSQIRKFNLKTGDIVQGNIRVNQGEKFRALLYVTSVNGFHPNESVRRHNFEDMTPVFPNERLILERPGGSTAMRIVDLISPIGKGQRGMIVSPQRQERRLC